MALHVATCVHEATAGTRSNYKWIIKDQCWAQFHWLGWRRWAKRRMWNVSLISYNCDVYLGKQTATGQKHVWRFTDICLMWFSHILANKHWVNHGVFVVSLTLCNVDRLSWSTEAGCLWSHWHCVMWIVCRSNQSQSVDPLSQGRGQMAAPHCFSLQRGITSSETPKA